MLSQLGAIGFNHEEYELRVSLGALPPHDPRTGNPLCFVVALVGRPGIEDNSVTEMLKSAGEPAMTFHRPLGVTYFLPLELGSATSQMSSLRQVWMTLDEVRLRLYDATPWIDKVLSENITLSTLLAETSIKLSEVVERSANKQSLVKKLEIPGFYSPIEISVSARKQKTLEPSKSESLLLARSQSAKTESHATMPQVTRTGSLVVNGVELNSMICIDPIDTNQSPSRPEEDGQAPQAESVQIPNYLLQQVQLAGFLVDKSQYPAISEDRQLEEAAASVLKALKVAYLNILRDDSYQAVLQSFSTDNSVVDQSRRLVAAWNDVNVTRFFPISFCVCNEANELPAPSAETGFLCYDADTHYHREATSEDYVQVLRAYELLSSEETVPTTWDGLIHKHHEVLYRISGLRASTIPVDTTTECDPSQPLKVEALPDPREPPTSPTSVTTPQSHPTKKTKWGRRESVADTSSKLNEIHAMARAHWEQIAKKNERQQQQLHQECQTQIIALQSQIGPLRSQLQVVRDELQATQEELAAKAKELEEEKAKRTSPAQSTPAPAQAVLKIAELENELSRVRSELEAAQLENKKLAERLALQEESDATRSKLAADLSQANLELSRLRANEATLKSDLATEQRAKNKLMMMYARCSKQYHIAFLVLTGKLWRAKTSVAYNGMRLADLLSKLKAELEVAPVTTTSGAGPTSGTTTSTLAQAVIDYHSVLKIEAESYENDQKMQDLADLGGNPQRRLHMLRRRKIVPKRGEPFLQLPWFEGNPPFSDGKDQSGKRGQSSSSSTSSLLNAIFSPDSTGAPRSLDLNALLGFTPATMPPVQISNPQPSGSYGSSTEGSYTPSSTVIPAGADYKLKCSLMRVPLQVLLATEQHLFGLVVDFVRALVEQKQSWYNTSKAFSQRTIELRRQQDQLVAQLSGIGQPNQPGSTASGTSPSANASTSGNSPQGVNAQSSSSAASTSGLSPAAQASQAQTIAQLRRQLREASLTQEAELEELALRCRSLGRQLRISQATAAQNAMRVNDLRAHINELRAAFVSAVVSLGGDPTQIHVPEIPKTAVPVQLYNRDHQQLLQGDDLQVTGTSADATSSALGPMYPDMADSSGPGHLPEVSSSRGGPRSTRGGPSVPPRPTSGRDVYSAGALHPASGLSSTPYTVPNPSGVRLGGSRPSSAAVVSSLISSQSNASIGAGTRSASPGLEPTHFGSPRRAAQGYPESPQRASPSKSRSGISASSAYAAYTAYGPLSSNMSPRTTSPNRIQLPSISGSAQPQSRTVARSSAGHTKGMVGDNDGRIRSILFNPKLSGKGSRLEAYLSASEHTGSK